MYSTGLPSDSAVKDLPAVQKPQVQSLGREDPLEEGRATHSSILAWRIPRTEEPGGLQASRVTKSQTLLKRLSTHAGKGSGHWIGMER